MTPRGDHAASRLFCPALLTVCLFFSPLAAQTTIVVANSSFEAPTPTTFPDYTVGATGWTRTNPAINAGTFSPGTAGTTPAPISGTQVGYADGFGGLQQDLTDTFSTGQFYTFSVYIGFRSDEVNSPFGTGAIALGFMDSGSFMSLGLQSTTAARGEFIFVTGSYQATAGVQGQSLALRLTSTDSYQVLFDQVQLSVSAVPEPAAFACAIGACALGLAIWKRRARASRPC
jgi:hypothetical protein